MSETKFKVYPDAKEKLEGLKVGYIQFEGTIIEKHTHEMDIMVEKAIIDVQKKFKDIDSIAKDDVIKAMRKLFSQVGVDPTKERPSAEALLRRVVGGKGIYRINTVVDTNNVISMTTGYPCGVYDADSIIGRIRLHIGKEGGKYIGIGRKEMSTDNRLLTKDDISIFGGPTADSNRTAVSMKTKNVLMLIYNPKEIPEKMLTDTIEEAKKKMCAMTGCTVKESGIYECTL